MLKLVRAGERTAVSCLQDCGIMSWAPDTPLRVPGMIKRASWVALLVLGVAASAGAVSARVATLTTLAPMLEPVLPSIVHVETESTVVVRQRLPFNDPFFRRFFRTPPPQQERRRDGSGSGVIIDAGKGHIITNSHVIHNAQNIVVTLSDGRRFDAELVGADAGTDIAILQIDAEALIEIRIGDSGKLRVGDFVVAVGNPFGLTQSVTSGIVSALGRSGLGIESYEDFIQTDASINRGNSGGALVNLDGELIGINTAILGSGGGNIGIGFAIPVNMAMEVAAQLLEFGEVKRGVLGVAIQSLTPDLAKAFGAERDYGVVISMIAPGSAAEVAALEVGDIVLSINGKPTKDVADMRNFIGLLRAGSEIEIEVLRGDRVMTVTAVIKERDKETIEGGKLDRRLQSAALQLVEPAEDLGVDHAVLVKSIDAGSLAHRQGLRSGDLILRVNRLRTESFDDFRRAILPARPILLQLHRDGRNLFIALR